MLHREMRLLHVTDFHGNRRWFDWVVDHATDFDAIAYTGDFLDMFGREPLAEQVRWVTTWAHRLPRSLLWCSGNHDVEPTASPVLSGRWLRELPGANAFDRAGRLHLLGHSFVRMDWQGRVPNLRDGDILLSHAPPAACLTALSLGGGDHGSLDLADAFSYAAASPWLVLSGHVHQPRRWKDRCGGIVSLNPGQNAGAKEPNHIVVDTLARKARWFSGGELKGVVVLPES